MSKRKLSDTDEHESDSDPQDEIDPSQRPRKKVYKSTLRKRNREKRRRDQFNEGLQQLAGKLSTQLVHILLPYSSFVSANITFGKLNGSKILYLALIPRLLLGATVSQSQIILDQALA